MASTSYNGSAVESPVASTSTSTRPAPAPAALEHADLYADLGSHLVRPL